MEHLGNLYAERARLAYLCEHGHGAEQEAARRAYAQAQEALARAFAALAAHQEPLGEPFSAILHKNLDDLLIYT
jgi:hypothetical protein